ncbi:MAG TPA: alpha/beta fold hydrolase [Solirubrobacteraceae bacterium]|nr:alpha/beta fold hydrolase [Solirubrobacteraceae bacterium]
MPSTPPVGTGPGRIGDRLGLRTVDGERLEAVHLEGPDPARSLCVVLAHGFTLSIARPTVRAVASALAGHAGVLAFDFRGHGRSSGHSTVGHREVLDLDAAVSAARRLGYSDVVTCGWSMGGGVVLRHAALHGGVDGVISISALSRWYYKDTRPMRRVHWAIETRLGRLIAHRAMRTRISAAGWDEDDLPEAPVDVVARISPIPVLLVHGDRDHYFPVEHPEALYAAANEPKELWLIEGFGHAESAATPELLDRIGAHLADLVARGPAH